MGKMVTVKLKSTESLELIIYSQFPLYFSKKTDTQGGVIKATYTNRSIYVTYYTLSVSLVFNEQMKHRIRRDRVTQCRDSFRARLTTVNAADLCLVFLI